MTFEPRHAATIPEALTNAVKFWPNKVWLDFSGQTWTFAEVDEASNRLARGLSSLGVRFGDRVAAMLYNHADNVLLWMALCKLGAVSLPINTAFLGEFLRHQMFDSGASIAVVDSDFVERFTAIAADLPQLRTLIYRGLPPVKNDSLAVTSFASVYGDTALPVDAVVGPDDLALLLYTSGTTGPSKGCMVGHRYICNAGWKPHIRIGVRHDDVYWTPCPLFHMGAAGALIGTLQSGTTMSIAPRFSLSAFWPEIERSRATVVMIISTMLNFVADAPDSEPQKRCFGQIRAIHGVPFGPALQARWKERFGVAQAGAIGYGMTEISPITLRYLDQPVPDGASGSRFEDYYVEIVDEADRILPPGESGEVVVRPRVPGVMFQGYWNRGEETVKTNRNLWFHTGDIGRFDDEGFFYWIDRKKDYLRRGGENISSYELETTFREHPDLEDVAVHAVPAAGGAEDEVKLTAILRPGSALTEESLCRWSIGRLPHYAIPRFIEFRAELPRNGVGRVLKYELRRQGVTPGSWDRSGSAVVVARSRGKPASV